MPYFYARFSIHLCSFSSGCFPHHYTKVVVVVMERKRPLLLNVSSLSSPFRKYYSCISNVFHCCKVMRSNLKRSLLALMALVRKLFDVVSKDALGRSYMKPNGLSSINPWNKAHTHKKYYEILEKRKTFPFWQQREILHF